MVEIRKRSLITMNIPRQQRDIHGTVRLTAQGLGAGREVTSPAS
jgi:hypothetical protein